MLESIEGGEKLARYSFIGFDPYLVVEGETDRVILKQGRAKKTIEAHPIEFMEELFSFYKPVKIETLPRFTGGAVGSFAYDSIRWFEDIPDNNPDSLQLPLMRFGLYNKVIAFDHLKQEIVIISNILHHPGEKGLKEKYEKACQDLEIVENKLSASIRRPVVSG